MMNTHYGHRSKGWVAEHVHVWVHNTTLTTCCVAKMKAAAALLGISAVSSRVSGFVAFPTSARSVGNGDQCSSQKTTGSRHALGAADEAQPPQAERPPERQFISILTEHGTEQMLPVASASSFPLWVIEKDDSGRQQIVQVPTASETGWVDPRSYSELWIPEESPAPTMKLCLGMLLRDGVPRYVMPMVDTVVSKAGDRWRNRGLNSFPISYCWEPVGRAAGGVLSMSAYVEERVEGSDVDSMWGTLADKLSVEEAFTDIVGVLADPPGGVQLDSGFHFLVAEVAGVDSLPVPAPGGRVRLFLSDLPEPADLLELPTTQGVAALSFDVVSVANGGESEFLPEVYKPLFVPETA